MELRDQYPSFPEWVKGVRDPQGKVPASELSKLLEFSEEQRSRCFVLMHQGDTDDGYRKSAQLRAAIDAADEELDFNPSNNDLAQVKIQLLQRQRKHNYMRSADRDDGPSDSAERHTQLLGCLLWRPKLHTLIQSRYVDGDEGYEFDCDEDGDVELKDLIDMDSEGADGKRLVPEGTSIDDFIWKMDGAIDKDDRTTSVLGLSLSADQKVIFDSNAYNSSESCWGDVNVRFIGVAMTGTTVEATVYFSCG